MNSTSEYSLTIVVPVFNEEDNIRNLEKALAEFIPVSKVKTCVLFVDDGSSDGSLRLIQETCQRQRDFFYISFSRNAGLSAAIKAGFDHTFSEYVGYMDADLQTSPQDFNLLIDGMKVHTLMTGCRADRKDTAFKRMQSRIANRFRNMMTHDGARDTGCPLKIIRTEAARRIPMFKGDAPFPAGPHSAAGWRFFRRGRCKAFSALRRQVQIQSTEQVLGTFG